jgi:hypothetical protein
MRGRITARMRLALQQKQGLAGSTTSNPANNDLLTQLESGLT